jgi:dihydrofolate reductase
MEMRKVIVSEFVSVDGIMEDPGGAEGYSRGGWTFKFDMGDEGNMFKFEELMAAEALLLGRVTYEGFAKAWPSMEDEAGFADKMNSMPKYVVSSTLENPTWNNTTVIRGDLAEEISKLKEQPGGDILVAGSAQLVQGLAAHDLVDSYRLMIFPIILGTGKRLFGDADVTTTLNLAEAKSVGTGVLTAVYERAA